MSPDTHTQCRVLFIGVDCLFFMWGILCKRALAKKKYFSLGNIQNKVSIVVPISVLAKQNFSFFLYNT